MSRFVGTFIIALLAGIAGIYLGSLINGAEWFGLLLPIAVIGGLITYYQAKVEEKYEKRYAELLAKPAAKEVEEKTEES